MWVDAVATEVEDEVLTCLVMDDDDSEVVMVENGCGRMKMQGVKGGCDLMIELSSVEIGSML